MVKNYDDTSGLHKERYLAVFGSQARFNEVKYALAPTCIDPAPEDKWMIMSDMEFLLAQKYKHVVVLLTGDGYSETYFPLEGEPPERENDMPWMETAENWPTRYIHRMANYNGLKRAHGGIAVGDSARPQHDKKVIDLEVDNQRSKVVEDDNFVEEIADLAHD
ncbi:FAR1-related protein [Trifolium medium]|uniref:FAR1-related protein n=1 Tax=Trifolium medium TaxID=97028 RepID=A0A392MM42_9FABA|nr:FAR1-related protein [Trifolium medium]